MYQVRRRGRADEAGLSEGDVLLTVNGRSCDGMSCGQAMDLVESSGQNVVLRVNRYPPADARVSFTRLHLL